jgi:D-alanyl-lipoteichoic acid acyltransferase DltB (MBOAT superfamily)
MLFNSYVFILFFLPVTLFVFYWIGGRGHHRVALSWLVGASLFFYGWWNPIYLALIFFSMLFNYAVGINLSQEHNQNLRARSTLIFGVAVNLGLLGYFKYANFFVDSVNWAIGADWHFEQIVLPLAISFFTFQQIAYLVDAYRGLTREYNFLSYCLFVTFFPQLIAGPIVHHREMLPQFAMSDTYRPQAINLAIGLSIFTVGLFKKVVIADNMATYATPVFSAADAGAQLTFLSAWTGVFAYTMQLYFDFSGYSDMAIGLGRMFGIKLPLNFNSPYQATSIIDFWRRWHMTLSRFLRDYLYIPLGGSRKGPVRRQINLMITMLLGGLWHGAGWTFVVWGGLHGLYLVVNHLWRAAWRPPLNRWWSNLIARLLTLLAVMVAWTFFRAETFEGAIRILDAMANLPSFLGGKLGPLEDMLALVGIRFTGGYLALDHYLTFAWGIFWIAVVWLWPNTQQLMSRFEPAFDEHVLSSQRPFLAKVDKLKWQPQPSWAIPLGLLGAVSLLSLSEISEFLYFQF